MVGINYTSIKMTFLTLDMRTLFKMRNHFPRSLPQVNLYPAGANMMRVVFLNMMN